MKQMLYEIPVHFFALMKKFYFAIGIAPFLRKVGKKSYIIVPSIIDKPGTVSLKDCTIINSNSWICSTNHNCSISIGNRVQIGHFFHCVCMESIVIGNEVLIADRVFLADCTHIYDNVTLSTINNGIKRIGKVEVGDGAWIGEGACVLGAKIGRHSVVGANSVVTHDVPDYCVVAGIPAKIIKQYDVNERKWINIQHGM